MFSRSLMSLSDLLDRRRGWDRVGSPLGVLTLLGLRKRLRQRNLYDTGLAEPSDELRANARDERFTSARTIDGTLNDLDKPLMGSVGARFGRNVPLEHTLPGAGARHRSSPTRARSAAS